MLNMINNTAVHRKTFLDLPVPKRNFFMSSFSSIHIQIEQENIPLARKRIEWLKRKRTGGLFQNNLSLMINLNYS